MEQQMQPENLGQKKEPKLTLSRDKHIIYFYNPKFPDVKLRYDLKLKQMEKFFGKVNQWKSVCNQYAYFHNLYINDIFCEEEHFRLLIEKAKEINPTCKNLSSFISRLSGALIYENYIRQGIQTECYISRRYSYGNMYVTKRLLSKPLEFYNKSIIDFFKKYKIQVSQALENLFIKDYNFMEEIMRNIELINLNREQVKFIFVNIFESEYNREKFLKIINTYRYEPKALLNYLFNYLKPFEDVDVVAGMDLLDDYYSMASKIGRNVKKYPKYLKSMHDIISLNFKAFKQYYDEKLFLEKIMPEFEYEKEGEKFCVINPKNPKDIINEGTSNNNCVASYVEKIMNGQTYLIFMRRTKEKENSLITLEVRNKCLVQYKGAYNRLPNEEEMNFLKHYCRVKEIKLIGGED